MNERDINVIEGMVSTGMDLPSLIKCLPQFSEENIKEVYDAFHERKKDRKDD